MLNPVFCTRVLRAALSATTFALASVLPFTAQANMSPAFANDTHTARFLWQNENVSLTDRAFSCPAVFAPKVRFESVSIYKDTPCRCEIDEEKKAAYDAELEQVKDYMSQLVRLADQYVATPVERDDIASCVMTHIASWTHHGAMLGEHAHSVGYHKTAEVLGAIASSYLKVRHSPAIEKITPLSESGLWLQSASQHVLYFYANIAGGRTQNNNHRYWDGYQVAQAGVVINDKALFQWGIDGLLKGLNEIDQDGALPRELERGSKAFTYHIYSMIPLIGLSELAVQNPQYMAEAFYPYSYADGALHRLSQMVIDVDGGLDHALFTDERAMRCHESAWLEAYSHRVTGTENDALRLLISERRSQCSGKLYNTIGGGDFSLMFNIPG